MKIPGLSRNFPFILMAAMLCGAFALFIIQGSVRNHQAGRKKPQASAPELISRGDKQRLQKFKLTGFDEHGKTFWNLEGDAAQIDPKQTIILDQNVTLRLQDDTVVRTDHVRWSQEGGALSTDAEVVVEHNEAHVVGRGSWGKPNEGYIQLHHDIVMDLKTGARVRCDGPLKIYYNENKMIFYRKVIVTDARGQLSANRMDVFFDPQEKKVREIVAEGNVVIEQGGDRTRSRRAIYSMKTGSVRLEGSPEITLTKTKAGILDGITGNPISS